MITNAAGTATTSTATLTVVAKPTAFPLTLEVLRDTPRPLTLAGIDSAGRPLKRAEGEDDPRRGQ